MKDAQNTEVEAEVIPSIPGTDENWDNGTLGRDMKYASKASPEQQAEIERILALHKGVVSVGSSYKHDAEKTALMSKALNLVFSVSESGQELVTFNYANLYEEMEACWDLMQEQGLTDTDVEVRVDGQGFRFEFRDNVFQAATQDSNIAWSGRNWIPVAPVAEVAEDELDESDPEFEATEPNPQTDYLDRILDTQDAFSKLDLIGDMVIKLTDINIIVERPELCEAVSEILSNVDYLMSNLSELLSNSMDMPVLQKPEDAQVDPDADPCHVDCGTCSGSCGM